MNNQLSYLTKEDLLKSEISNILMETKDELNRFKKEVECTESSLEEIKKIQSQLSAVQGRLKELNDIAKNANNLYKKASKMLGDKKKELIKINRDIISEGWKQVIVLIDNNLPDYMRLNAIKGLEQQILIEVIEHQNTQPKIIGTVQIIDYEDKNILQVKMEKHVEIKEFEIENSFRVYDIVNYIISAHGYKPRGKKLK